MRNLFTCEDGSALVEVALALPLLALMLAGVIDYGVYNQRKMQATEAANAGAAFAAVPGNQQNLTGIQNAARAASPMLSGLSATATVLYTCTVGGTLATTAPSCSGGTVPYQYIKVSTSASVPAMLQFVGLPSSIVVNGQALYRIVS